MQRFFHNCLTRENKQSSRPLICGHGCPVVVQSRCQSKEERGKESCRALSVHSSMSLSSHQAQQGSKLQPQPSLAISFLGWAVGCNEFAEGGVVEKRSNPFFVSLHGY